MNMMELIDGESWGTMILIYVNLDQPNELDQVTK